LGKLSSKEVISLQFSVEVRGKGGNIKSLCLSLYEREITPPQDSSLLSG
jgi:hypothetical protein